MLKYLILMALAFVGSVGCAVDEADNESVETPVESEVLRSTVYAQYPPTNIWGHWAYFDEEGFKVRAFEGNYDGHIDIQFLATKEQTQDWVGKVVQVFYSCTNAAGGQRDNFYTKPNQLALLPKRQSIGVDFNDVAICAPGKRPIDVLATIEIE